ncbi:hypothetical protein [Pseudobacteriovorax antillogorgiicola]|uniref:Lipoprotein n=1 Tax=Pseudobacteriovorax antillogorgiicola TaxID=1513793 RepID=A0A1Y6BXK1_9BACT|nr:hypothetical protein [Pseudobacteriovorax antillogorgiicola]TCS53057.1 hypothetical protein EDD56_108108 [Pseudobacteriovorax antillogorgiicola]SMF26363.1 hypothetical protein SAMN06296036_108139 [Pseudobacteriovorax antillogorgiicola]
MKIVLPMISLILFALGCGDEKEATSEAKLLYSACKIEQQSSDMVITEVYRHVNQAVVAEKVSTESYNWCEYEEESNTFKPVTEDSAVPQRRLP